MGNLRLTVYGTIPGGSMGGATGDIHVTLLEADSSSIVLEEVVKLQAPAWEGAVQHALSR